MKRMNNKKTNQDWERKFLGLALYYSTFSKDPSTKVGCVLVNEYKTPVGFGFNGFSRESDDDTEFLNNRDLKYPRTIHAEVNAIYNSNDTVRGTTAYVTHPPCVSCITHLSQNGIKHVVFVESEDEGFCRRFNLDETIEELLRLNIGFTSYRLRQDDIDAIFDIRL